MAKTDKLTLTLSTAAELSEAVAVHVPMKRVQKEVNRVTGRTFAYLAPGLRPEAFDISDPRHWMLVVEAMREEAIISVELASVDNIYVACVGIGNDEPRTASGDSPGIAIGLAALWAMGINVEWKGE